MARLEIGHDRLRVHLNWWEKLCLRRSHLTIPLHAISSAQVVDNAATVLGEGRFEQAILVPGLTACGVHSTDEAGGRTFVVAHRQGPGVLLSLNNATFDRIVVSTNNPSHDIKALQAVIG